jgi:predicted permease
LLIGVQIALTFVLLGVAGEAIMGFVQTTSMKLGYDPHHVGFITVPLKADPTKNQPAYAGYIARLRDAMAAIPGVVSVGILSSGIPPSQPLGSAEALPPFEVFGTPRDEQQKALVQLVSPEYFATLKTPLLRGRLWSQDENRLGDSVAVVNDTFAKRYLGERDAIGQQLRTDAVKDDGAPLSITSPHSNQWRQVVGVVADSQNVGLERSVAPTIYLPYTTFMWNTTQFFLRTAGDPQSMEHSLRTAVHTFNPEQRIAGNKIGTLDEVLSTQNLWVQQRILSVLFSFFGGLALCLCLLGITSTVLFAARRRKSELGIRMALGASPRHIVWAVSSQTLFAIAGGLAAGMLCNMALRKLVEHWMPGGHDAPWIALPVAAMLAIGAAIASLMPAVRASHADPMEALRSD